MSKRKRIVLNFQQKIEILQQLNEGKSGATLAKQYGIGTSTISDIKRNGDSILQFVSNLDSQNQLSEKKTRKTAQNTDLDSQVYKWYVAEKAQWGCPPTDAVICSKALEINQQLTNGNQNFKASPGWLRHFKNRHALNEQEKEIIPNVKKQFKNSLKRGGFILENVYNFSEAVLEWNSLPNSGNKFRKAVTLISCTNANVSHKLPLWIMGQEKIQNEEHSVIYKNRKSVVDWFENCFIPEVTKRQQNTGNVGKIMLITDSSYEGLLQNQNQIELFFIDKNLQPLESGVKPVVKITYRKKMLQTLSHKPLLEFSLNDCISLCAETWNSISKTIVLRAWSTLMSNFDETLNFDKEIAEIVGLASQIPELSLCGVDEITQWLESDEDYTPKLNFDDYEEDNEQDEHSHLEAYQCLETVIQWFEKQKECNSVQLSTLKSVRDLAASKLCGNMKQETD